MYLKANFKANDREQSTSKLGYKNLLEKAISIMTCNQTQVKVHVNPGLA